MDESVDEKRVRDCNAASSCGGDFIAREFADCLSDQAVTEVAIGGEIAGGNPGHTGVTGQVNRVRDDGCGGIGIGGAFGQNGDGGADAERETAAAPSAGGEAANSVRPVQT